MEELTGTLKDVTDKLLQLYCIDLTGSKDKFRYIGVSSLNDISVNRHKYPESKYRFWAGCSGCNWNLIDCTGGNHMCKNFEMEIVTVKVPEKWSKYTSLI